MAVFYFAVLQLLGANPSCAILPHMDQLCICVCIMYVCLGRFLASDRNIHAGPLGQIHHCLLLWSNLEHCLNGPCWSKVCLQCPHDVLQLHTVQARYMAISASL